VDLQMSLLAVGLKLADMWNPFRFSFNRKRAALVVIAGLALSRQLQRRRRSA
jgi:hypothetical protein